MSKRDSYSGFGGHPLTLNPLQNGGGRRAEFCGPILHALRLAVRGYDSVAAFVSSLFNAGRPPAVSRFVMAGVVDPVYGRAVRPWPHILREYGKVAIPFLADSDASPAVVAELRVVGVVAPVLDSAPNCIQRGPALTVAAIGRRCAFPLKAPTRLNASGAQVECADHLGVSAIAKALPKVCGPTFFSVPDHNQSTDAKAGPVDKFHTFHLVLLTVKAACRATVNSLFGSYPRHATTLYREVAYG